MSLQVKDLRPGSKFRVVGLNPADEVWELIHLGTGSALVRRTTREARTFETMAGNVVTFTAPSKSFTISLQTNVEEIDVDA